MSDDVRHDANRPELDGPENDAAAAEEATAAAAGDTFEQASDAEPELTAEDADAAQVNAPETDEEIDSIAEPELPGKLERLQKILAQAGVASRRHAETLITEGRVQVNGKVVTELGTKADAARDHIRVDGKLLQGSERLRYFMLNKPRGFVTTVSDPEGRPTWKKDDRTARPPARFGERAPGSEQRPAQFGSVPPREGRPTVRFAGSRRPAGGRPFEKKPWQKPGSDRPPLKPHAGPRRDVAPASEGLKPPRPPRLQIEAVEPDRESPIRATRSRPPTGRSTTGRPPFRGAGSDQPRPDRPRFDRPSFDRPGGARPIGGSRRTGAREFGAGRPPRAEGEGSRPFTTSTGKPRAGGARPSNKRSGPSTGKPGWKPKPGGAGRPASGGRAKPSFGSRPGGFSKSGPGFKGKTGGGRKPAAGRTGGSRPGGKGPAGKRAGGKPGGKKRS